MGLSTEQHRIENVLMLARLLKQHREKDSAADSLRSFIKAAWSVIEPGVPYVHGWHIDAIADHLEAVQRGDIRRLIINIPPRSSKSTIASISFPSWVWIKNPEKRFVFSSHDLRLSLRDSRKCRALIGSSWYQRNWPDAFKILSNRGGQDTKERFDNDKGGFRVATSTDTGFIGEGGDCLDGSVRIMTNHGEISIRDIVEKRLPVLALGSSGEFRRIEAYGRRKGTELIEFEMENGVKLPCTENHPIFTEYNGFMAAKDVISYSYADLYLRHLPRFIREGGGACGPWKTRAILFAGLLRKVLHRTAEPWISWWSNYKEMQAMWGRVLLQESYGSALFPMSCLQCTNGADILRLLPRDVSASQSRESVLFDQLRTESNPMRKGEWSLHSRTQGRDILGWLHGCAPQGDQSTRWMGVHGLWQDITSGIAKDRSASRGRWEDQPLSTQPCVSLQAMPPQDSSEEWPESRLDERVRIKTVRRLPAPDYVYNLQVAVDNDYYANGVLTHNCILYDDPNDIRQMTSDPYIESVIYFHEHVMASRLNDPKTGARVCIQQRSGERDMTGHILSKESGWEHLVIPMEYEGPSKITSIGWSDPRRAPGELMCPERLGPAEVVDLKKNSMLWSGQYQQRPSPGEGDKFKRQWWNYWNPENTETGPVRIAIPGEKTIEKKPVSLPPAFEQIVQSWDMAFKDEKENDFVAGHVWGRIGANVYLLDRIKQRLDFPKSLKAVRKMSEKYPCPEKLIEDKANGPAVIATLRNEIPGLIAVAPDGGKIARAQAIVPYVESGNVFLPNPDIHPWVTEIIEECAAFPRGKYDDDVDALSQALRRLFDSISNTAVPEFRVIPRPGEPETACHIEKPEKMAVSLRPNWRTWIAVSPGPQGAALWLKETPSGSLRVYRELSIAGQDAFEAGRAIARATVPDIRDYMGMVHLSAKWNIELLLEKAAFVPVEPIGSYAELLEEGLLAHEPTEGPWDERESISEELKLARFSAQMAEVEDAAIDRLRDLLRFAPPDFEELSWDRAKAHELARRSTEEFQRYMAAVEGRVHGEYPRIKMSSACPQIIAALGTVKRDEDVEDSFLRALLIGISAPPNVMSRQPVKEVPWNARAMKQSRLAQRSRRSA